jgi:hypothetical protein
MGINWEDAALNLKVLVSFAAKTFGASKAYDGAKYVSDVVTNHVSNHPVIKEFLPVLAKIYKGQYSTAQLLQEIKDNPRSAALISFLKEKGTEFAKVQGQKLLGAATITAGAGALTALVNIPAYLTNFTSFVLGSGDKNQKMIAAPEDAAFEASAKQLAVIKKKREEVREIMNNIDQVKQMLQSGMDVAQIDSREKAKEGESPGMWDRIATAFGDHSYIPPPSHDLVKSSRDIVRGELESAFELPAPEVTADLNTPSFFSKLLGDHEAPAVYSKAGFWGALIGNHETPSNAVEIRQKRKGFAATYADVYKKWEERLPDPEEWEKPFYRPRAQVPENVPEFFPGTPQQVYQPPPDIAPAQSFESFDQIMSRVWGREQAPQVVQEIINGGPQNPDLDPNAPSPNINQQLEKIHQKEQQMQQVIQQLQAEEELLLKQTQQNQTQQNQTQQNQNQTSLSPNPQMNMPTDPELREAFQKIFQGEQAGFGTAPTPSETQQAQKVKNPEKSPEEHNTYINNHYSSSSTSIQGAGGGNAKRKQPQGTQGFQRNKKKTKTSEPLPLDYSFNPLGPGLEIYQVETSKDKIEQPPLASDEKKIIPPIGSSVIISGKSGSGKSTLLQNLLTDPRFYGKSPMKPKGWFSKIFLFAPTGSSDDILKALNIPEKHVFTDMDEAPAFLKVIQEAQSSKLKGGGKAHEVDQYCVIFEDVIGETSFMNTKEFRKMFYMVRHINSTTFICTQHFNRVPRMCRLQASFVYFFAGSAAEVEILVEMFAPPMYNKKEFTELVNDATKGKHNFLTICMKTDWKWRFRRNLGDFIDLPRLVDDEEDAKEEKEKTKKRPRELIPPDKDDKFSAENLNSALKKVLTFRKERGDGFHEQAEALSRRWAHKGTRGRTIW